MSYYYKLKKYIEDSGKEGEFELSSSYGEIYISIWNVPFLKKPTLKKLDELYPDDLNEWAQIRTKRNSALSASDWTQLNDNPLKDDENWLEYRQKLRDITADFDDPAKVVWPEKPE